MVASAVRYLRRTWWWRWVGVLWGALTVVTPTAVYIVRVSR